MQVGTRLQQAYYSSRLAANVPPRGKARVQKVTRGCFGGRVGGARPFSLAAFSLPPTADAEPPGVIPCGITGRETQRACVWTGARSRAPSNKGVSLRSGDLSFSIAADGWVILGLS